MKNSFQKKLLTVCCALSAFAVFAQFSGNSADARRQLRWEHGRSDGWKLENGTLSLTPAPTDGLRIAISEKLTPADGYVIKATMEFPDTKSGGHAGFLVRRSCGKACYVHLTPDGKYLGVSGAADKLLEKFIPAPKDGKHTLEIRVTGDSLAVSVDGRSCISAGNLTGDAKGVAFMSFKAPVKYSGITVTPLTAAAAPAPAPTAAAATKSASVLPPVLFSTNAADAARKLRWEHGLQNGWKLENGTLTLTPAPTDGLRVAILEKCTPADGYVIRATMEFSDPTSSSNAGFLVRRSCGKACFVHLGANGKYLGVTGVGDKILEKYIPAPKNGKHTLEIRVDKEFLIVSVDGKQYIATGKLPGNAEGTAFISFKTQVKYSDVTVTPLHVPAATAPVQTRTSRRGFMVSELTPEIVRELKNTWHANIVRLQLIPLFWAPKKGITHAEAWSWMMKQLPGWLDNARDAGILVVIDLHNLPRPFPPGPEKESLQSYWEDLSYRQLFLDCWNEIAHICKDRPEELWFDLKNEPLNWADMPSYPKAWPDWAQAGIDVIRVTDKKHHIVIEPGPGGLCWGFKDFKPLRDPMNKLIYSAHQYQPHIYAMQGIRDITGTDLSHAYLQRGLHWPGNFNDNGGGWWDKKRLEEHEMACVIEFQKKYNARIFIGEFSVCRWAPEGAQFLDDCISIFEKYGWDWTYHAFRESRIWSLEHDDSYTSEPKLATTPTARARVVRKYLDRNLEK